MSKEEQLNNGDEKLYANINSSYVIVELRVAVAHGDQRETRTLGCGGQAFAILSKCVPPEARCKQAVWIGDSWQWRHGHYIHVRRHDAEWRG